MEYMIKYRHIMNKKRNVYKHFFYSTDMKVIAYGYILSARPMKFKSKAEAQFIINGLIRESTATSGFFGEFTIEPWEFEENEH